MAMRLSLRQVAAGGRSRLREALADLALAPDEAPAFRGWEFRAPATLRVTFRPH